MTSYLSGYFSSWAAFIHMGGYADYVWSAYGLAALVLLGNGFWALKKRRQLLKQLRRRYAPHS